VYWHWEIVPLVAESAERSRRAGVQFGKTRRRAVHCEEPEADGMQYRGVIDEPWRRART